MGQRVSLYLQSIVSMVENIALKNMIVFNIFSKGQSLLNSLYQGIAGLVVGIFSIALILIFIGCFAGSQESKQKMKSALPWAFLAFIGALSVNLIINWVQTNW